MPECIERILTNINADEKKDNVINENDHIKFYFQK